MNIKKIIIIAMSVLACLALGAGSYLYFKDTTPPLITLTPDSGPVGKAAIFTARAEDPSGIRSMSVILIENGKRTTLASAPADKSLQSELTFDLAKTGFKNGPFELEITAVDASYHRMGKGNSNSKTASFMLDSKKPRIAVESMQHNLNRGGSGAIAYTVNESVTSSGVRIGNRFFPGYELPSGDFACIFAFPYDIEVADFQPKLEATDLAGNTRSRTFAFHVNNRTFRHDTINLPDSFLQAKMPQYEDYYPDEPDLLSVYLKVNGEMRIKDRAAILSLGQTSSSEASWKGSFLRLPNAANRARFADSRTYRYNGKDVDYQTHLGIDLASLKNAPIPAANAGRIVRTGFHGIYGENVIIDHGLGLMSLYSHLSQIDVEDGDIVTKGQIIGRTGATGLAGGDHLHFGVYVSGVAVNPVEWWDASWIRNNIASRVGQ
ncbi:M23 family metallopeptidase [Desulfovibrio ferrophilus]|uniref:M23 family metallopeptidase n=1 Tax=Desulfovibrio ferrophilus TaxID=241368 RepID=UPI001E3965F6|nr:M23 family metallopeptidase [Desulfovibrio ferrophilus]